MATTTALSAIPPEQAELVDDLLNAGFMLAGFVSGFMAARGIVVSARTAAYNNLNFSPAAAAGPDGLHAQLAAALDTFLEFGVRGEVPVMVAEIVDGSVRVSISIVYKYCQTAPDADAASRQIIIPQHAVHGLQRLVQMAGQLAA